MYFGLGKYCLRAAMSTIRHIKLACHTPWWSTDSSQSTDSPQLPDAIASTLIREVTPILRHHYILHNHSAI